MMISTLQMAAFRDELTKEANWASTAWDAVRSGAGTVGKYVAEHPWEAGLTAASMFVPLGGAARLGYAGAKWGLGRLLNMSAGAAARSAAARLAARGTARAAEGAVEGGVIKGVRTALGNVGNRIGSAEATAAKGMSDAAKDVSFAMKQKPFGIATQKNEATGSRIMGRLPRTVGTGLVASQADNIARGAAPGVFPSGPAPLKVNIPSSYVG